MGTALITGASAGLGVEYAKLFAADKHDLVLVARRRDRLDQLAAELAKTHGIKTLVVAADLNDPAAPQAVFDEVTKAGVEVEFLVNNAGFGTTGAFAGLELAKEVGQINVNCTALVALTRLFLPAMVKRGRGRVLNIGSTAGFQAGPYMATYYATKAFVVSFTEALAYELKGTGVTATVSCPGATATEFSTVSGNDKSRLFTMQKPMGAPEVARQGYVAMHGGAVISVHGLMNKLGVWSTKLTPRAILRAVAATVNSDPNASKQLKG
ncbi:MAG: SDR family oxidoreductase [Myxococcaceae bacterium]|nr:SDR family oxidoreductase [Myxococcaceae bacterium]